MLIPLSVQAPAIVHTIAADEPRGVTRTARGRGETRDQTVGLAVACRDVIDEVRLRMARRGFLWD